MYIFSLSTVEANLRYTLLAVQGTLPAMFIIDHLTVFMVLSTKLSAQKIILHNYKGIIGQNPYGEIRRRLHRSFRKSFVLKKSRS